MNRFQRGGLGLLLSGCACLATAGKPAAGRDNAGDLSVAVSSSPESGSGEVLRLSLEEAIQRARSASPRLDQLRSLRDGAEAGVKGARAERLPQVDLTAAYTRLSNVPELSIPLPPPGGTRTLYPNLPDNYSARLEMTLPLFTGGRLSSLIDAASQERDAAGSDVDTGGQDLVLETSTTYWNLVMALEGERVLREALRAYDAHMEDTGRRAKYGLAAKNEVLAVQVERDRAELALVRATHSAEVLRADLARILALSGEIRVEPTGMLARLEPTREETSVLVQEARASRPERAALLARIEAADERARAARADRIPQAWLSAGYDYADPNRRILPWTTDWKDTWNASIGLSFEVFDGGRSAASFDQISAQAQAARHQLDDLDRRIELDVTRGSLELLSATAAVDVAEKGLESARENVRVSSDRYQAGLIPSSELLDSEVALLQSGLERTKALASQRLALAALQRAVGR